MIRREQWEESGASTIREAIRGIPGVQAPINNGTGDGDFAQNIGIRGLSSRLTSLATVLLDGVPLSNAPYGQPELSLAPISLGNLKAIDVVKGGSAVRYGPQNVGGVINYVTKDIPARPGGSLSLRGNAFGGPSDGGGQGQADLVLGGATSSGLGAALLYSGSRGAGFRQNQNQNIDDAIVKYQVPLTDTSQVEGRLHYYDANAKLAGPLSQAAYNQDPFQSTHSYERFEGRRKEAVLKYLNEFDGRLGFETTMFYTDSYRQYTLANGPDTRLTQLDRLPRNYGVFGIEPRLSGKATTGPLGHEMSVGYRYVNEQTDEKRMRRSGFGTGGNPFSRAEATQRYTTGSTRANALYADDKITWGNLAVTPGVRFENVDVRRTNKLTGYRDQASYDEILPALSVGYAATPDLFVFANANSSFGAVPQLALNTAGSQTRLEAERARIYETGARWRRGGLSLEGTIFLIDFDNMIEFDAAAGLNVNKGAARSTGFEGGASYDIGTLWAPLAGLSAYGTYTYTKATWAQGVNKGNDLRLYSRQVGTAGLRYQLQRLTFDANTYAQSHQYGDDANTTTASADGKAGIIPGYAVWNLQAAYKFEQGPTFALGINNLFDRRYYTRASIEDNGGLFVAAPRTVYVQTSFTF